MQEDCRRKTSINNYLNNFVCSTTITTFKTFERLLLFCNLVLCWFVFLFVFYKRMHNIEEFFLMKNINIKVDLTRNLKIKCETIFKNNIN